VLFGICALVWPGITLLGLTFLVGVYAFCDGIFAIVLAARREDAKNRWLLMLDGILGICAAIVAVVWPGVTVLFLVYLFAFRGLSIGVMQLAAAFKLDLKTGTKVLYALAGVASIAVGVALIVAPLTIGIVTLLAFAATYGLVFGALMIAAGLYLRSELTSGGGLGGGTPAAIY
jgi:uncharacterized membrane protein HdeD (DUF308 family)